MLYNIKKGPDFGPFYGIYPTLNSSGMQSIHVHMGEEVELWGEESFWKDDSACHTYIALITFAGFPAMTTSSGMSCVTTEPAPTITRFPIVTPGQTITPPPSQQSSPI